MTRNIIIACFCIILGATNVFAQNQDSLDNTIKSLATDLAALQSEIEKSYNKYQLAQDNQKLNVIAPNAVVITKDGSHLMAGADMNSSKVVKAKAGEEFKVVDKVNDWYAVEMGDASMPSKTAWVNAAYVAPTKKSFTDKVIGKILITAQKIKEQYKDNNYIKITGFSVEIGLPPSLNVSFELKE